MSRAPELRALAFAALSGCGALAPGAPRAEGSNEPASPGAAPPETLSTTELDAASSRALGALPRELGRFRLDPYARVRGYGRDAAAPLERACEQILGPGCNDVPGLEHVVALRYVDTPGADPSSVDTSRDAERANGQRSRASLDVLVTRYEDADAAYASFTDSVIGEHDPEQLGARPLDVPGLGVLDGQRVEAWLGRYVVGVSYSDPTAPSEASAARAAAELPGAVRRLLGALPAEPELPLAVQKLPRAHRLPLGVRLLSDDALGVSGMGGGAIGYYRDGDKRWRVLAIVRSDAESARDVLTTLGRSPAAHRIEKAPLEAFAFTERHLPTEPHVGWVVGQRHEVVYGVGDEATALPEFMPAEREAAVKLSLLDKLAKLTKVHLE